MICLPSPVPRNRSSTTTFSMTAYGEAARVRLRECLADYRRDQLEMAARRDLGHDAAVGRVQLRLRGDDAGADLALVGDERGRSLVAARLEPENQLATGSFHMISASSRLSV